MTIRGKEYRELFLSCVKEGYDYAEQFLNSNSQKKFKCPYEDLAFDSYEHDAWWTGVEWYRARVH